MIVGALNAKGGQEWLEQLADKEPASFATLIGKVLPMQVTGEGGGAIVVRWERDGSGGDA